MPGRRYSLRNMAKPKGEPKLASCTPDDVFNSLKKVGSFVFFEGAKHTKVTHVPTGRSSTIPRHGVIKRQLMKNFVEDFLVKECGIDTEELFKYLWC